MKIVTKSFIVLTLISTFSLYSMKKVGKMGHKVAQHAIKHSTRGLIPHHHHHHTFSEEEIRDAYTNITLPSRPGIAQTFDLRKRQEIEKAAKGLYSAKEIAEAMHKKPLKSGFARTYFTDAKQQKRLYGTQIKEESNEELTQGELTQSLQSFSSVLDRIKRACSFKAIEKYDEESEQDYANRVCNDFEKELKEIDKILGQDIRSLKGSMISGRTAHKDTPKLVNISDSLPNYKPINLSYELEKALKEEIEKNMKQMYFSYEKLLDKFPVADKKLLDKFPNLDKKNKLKKIYESYNYLLYDSGASVSVSTLFKLVNYIQNTHNPNTSNAQPIVNKNATGNWTQYYYETDKERFNPYTLTWVSKPKEKGFFEKLFRW